MSKTIFLVGFMGVGKTKSGRKLALKLGRQFIDLDHFIEEQHSKSISEIIDTYGMDQFRIWESEALRQIPLTNVICSTGGGAPCYFNNMDWMNLQGITVWLKLSPAAIIKRLTQVERDNRPLLRGKNDDELRLFVGELLDIRLPFYQKASIDFDCIKSKLSDLIVQLRALDA